MSYHVIGTCVHYYIIITDIALLFGKMLPLDLTVKATLNVFVLHMVNKSLHAADFGLHRTIFGLLMVCSRIVSMLRFLMP